MTDVGADPLTRPLDQPGAIGEVSFSAIAETLRARRVRHVVEYGSGRSTSRLERAIDARITSIEHDPAWSEVVRQAVSSARLQVHLRPLELRSFGGRSVLTYGPTEFDPPIDAVIIDGPPFWTLRGREACLYEIYDQLPVGALVVLDDCYREGEAAALRNWAQVYPGSFVVRIERASHGLAFLEKAAHVRPNWDAAERLADALDVEQRYREVRSLLTEIGSFRASAWPLDQMRTAFGMPEAPSARTPALRAGLVRLGEILQRAIDPNLP